MALAAYRHVLRATRIAFKDDTRVLHSARHQARSMFQDNSSMLAASPEVDAQIAHAEEVAQILRRNVVQGRKVEGEGSRAEEVERFHLRIHKETEKGDNESIKKAAGSTLAAGPGCGSGPSN